VEINAKSIWAITENENTGQKDHEKKDRVSIIHTNMKKDMARKEKGASLWTWKRRAQVEPALNKTGGKKVDQG
jgi:hypothetical protein